VTHIAITLFFGIIFIAIGVCAQMMVKEYWEEIAAALGGRQPVRRVPAGPRFKVRLRPNPGFAPARRRSAAV
jgi:hypothetical protein